MGVLEDFRRQKRSVESALRNWGVDVDVEDDGKNDVTDGSVADAWISVKDADRIYSRFDKYAYSTSGAFGKAILAMRAFATDPTP